MNLLARRFICGGLLLAALVVPTWAQSNYATPYYFTTLAGVTDIGSADGPGSLARFNGLAGIAFDSTGNLFVADCSNQTIRKITPAGVVTTFAGKPGFAGSADGAGSTARFSVPKGVAVDQAGNLYVADTGNSTIRKITPVGAVTTLAGSAGVTGSTDGAGSAARFFNPIGIAVDSAGFVYVSDTSSNVIRKITPAGVVSTLAGTAKYYGGSADGAGPAASFHGPQGIAVDSAGNLYVADTDNYTIRKVTPAGVVTTLAGSVINPGHYDGSGGSASFNSPWGVTVDRAGAVYVTDQFSIRKITPEGIVTTLAGGSWGDADGAGSAASFRYPEGIAVDASGNLAVADTGNSNVRRITPTGSVTTVAGLSAFQAIGSTDGLGAAARFFAPNGIAVDSSGSLFVADTGNSLIRKITPAGVVTTFAGKAGDLGGTDGTGSDARFKNPAGIAIGPSGDFYVADTYIYLIRRITTAGVVTTIAGSAAYSGSADGTGNAARFGWPEGVAANGAGNIYVADTGNHTIRKISLTGVVTTLAGVAGSYDSTDGTGPGYADGTGSAARFNHPAGLAVGSAGDIFVADSANHAIRRITPAGVVTTFAGTAGVAGSADGTGSGARFNYPGGIASDPVGNLYVIDWNTIRKITPAGVVTTLAGIADSDGFRDGTGSEALFYDPRGLAVDAVGNLYVADGNTIRKGQLAGPPMIAAQPQSQTVAPGSSVSFTVTAGGVPDPTYQWYVNGSAFSGATTNTLSFGNARSSDAGAYTVVVTNAVGSVTSNPAALTVSAATNSVPVTAAASGGGAIDTGLVLALLALAGLRCDWMRRTICRGVLLAAVVAPAWAATDYSTPYAFTTVAGTASIGSTDGPGSVARFCYPYGVAVDAAGNLYVADTSNHTIRRISASGIVTTLAGTAGNVGFADGTGSAAQFSDPESVAVDGSGNVYVAVDNTVRKITASGVVTTLAGVAGPSNWGTADGAGSAARFSGPQGVATDAAGNVYVADSWNFTIRKITPAGAVTTLAGLAAGYPPADGSGGSVDGPGSAARFDFPRGVATDGAGNVYVADTWNHTIRKITPDGVVSTLAGLAGNRGAADGPGGTARFNGPYGVAVDGAGNLYVADHWNSTIRKITPDGLVTTLAGLAGRTGSADGAGSAARFGYPSGVAVDGNGNVFVADPWINTIRKITPAGLVSTVAGLSAFASAGSTDGPGSVARFSGPQGAAVDRAGNVYIADTINSTIRKITADGLVRTLAGTAGSIGSTDGTGSAARLYYPKGVATDGAGNVYFADNWNHTVRRINPAGVVTTLAGLAGSSGSTDDTGSAARFYGPEGIAVDGAGNLYVADNLNHTIRKVTPNGAVTTLAGTAGSSGSIDGTGSAARFNFPEGVAVDGSGNLYVADFGNFLIRKITTAGVVTTLAGMARSYGWNDGAGSSALFNGPEGISVDGAGNAYVTDNIDYLIREDPGTGVAVTTTGNYTIRRISPAGVVSTLAGMGRGSSDGVGNQARFDMPMGIAVDVAGNVYVSCSSLDSNTIRKGQPAAVPAITTQPQSQTVAPGASVSFTVTAGGVPDPTYQWYVNGSAFSGATTNALSFTNARNSDAGAYTVVVTNALGSVTSNAATLTVFAAPAAPPASGGGGGGAPSLWFYGALSLLLTVRKALRRR
jgi:sugar lactone lactonase YvrE